jgi:ribosomal protein S18 acetylase RimI-like enzyme
LWQVDKQDNMPTADDLIFIRLIEFERDRAPLKCFLSSADGQRLDRLQPAVEQGNAVLLVAAREHQVFGWVVVHTSYRADLGWYVDGDTIRFQSGENVYVEYLEVETEMRGRGIGRMLLTSAEAAIRPMGKRILWLHTDEQNKGAQRFYEREGWTAHATVYPVWRDGAPMRVYRKEINGEVGEEEYS